jgi:hypothetical protein
VFLVGVMREWGGSDTQAEVLSVRGQFFVAHAGVRLLRARFKWR